MRVEQESRDPPSAATLAALERFVIENDELLQLESLIGTFNIFDALRIARAEMLPARSQTLFGNAVCETPFRGIHRVVFRIHGTEKQKIMLSRETEFRGIRSQTEFGNEGKVV